MSVFWQIAVSVVSSVIIAVLLAGFVVRIRFERLEATLEEREKHRIEDRVSHEARMNNHAELILKNSDHETRLKMLEQEVSKIREAYHNFRRDEIENVYALFRRWKDEMVETFVRKK